MKPTYLVATTNRGKFSEITNFFGEKFNLISMNEKKIDPCDEIFDTFVENALLKARYVSKTTNLPVLADDSGLVVEALNGSPGVKSARFSQGIAGLTRDEANNLKLLDCMSSFVNAKQRQAYFVSVVVGVSSYLDPFPAIGIGTWHGQISTHLSGDNGHGYDPIFYCPIAKKTAAQMTVNEKLKYSHRGRSLKNIFPFLIEKNFK